MINMKPLEIYCTYPDVGYATFWVIDEVIINII